VDKVIENGMVAVLYTPVPNTGWYTLNKNVQECVFDPTIVGYVLNQQKVLIPQYALNKWGESFCSLYSLSLQIKWLAIDQLFQILEINGQEWINRFDPEFLRS